MKYSIVLPVRNGGHYVKECVDSILRQTLPDLNLVVLDNCSTDGTLAWLQSLRDERIILHPAPQPLSIEANWARIRTVPRNEFMTMIGHDDLLHPRYLEVMDQLIHRHPNATLYQAHYAYIDAEGRFVRDCLPMDEQQYVHEFLACQMGRTIDSTGTGYMMRSADYDRAGGMPSTYPNLIFADFALWLQLMTYGYKATAFERTFSYRVHNSVSRTTNGMAFLQAFGEYVKEIALLQTGNPLLQQAAERYGHDFLLFWCESLSHRLLKTPMADRSLKVDGLIQQFNQYAQQLIPGQAFRPLSVGRIRLARQLDSFGPTRSLFQWYRRQTGNPS
ncbi:MAG: glycosyltransferase [Candidatus Pseudobacter hemicellulosilyticus]|uniref:Glycosyltransferase n=1 Tax=Candidatus Pseudobacter hemicellulosilyticus TaxID=3121375 RepID=A0AAJ6BEK8_9BACT|nr:MAG: glycosyltransferase [Pseudobacter sp.]